MAINCSTILEISKGCDTNRGSITALYVADQLSVTSVTISNGTVTAITTTSAFVSLEFNRNAGNFTEDLERNETTGARIYNQVLNVTIPRREVAKKNAIMILGEGDRELAIVTKDGNGLYNYWPNMILTTVGGGSGENRKAGSSYTLAFTNESEKLADYFDSSLITSIL